MQQIIEFIDGDWDGQRDQYHHVPVPERFEPTPALSWEQLRDERLHEIRWWSVDEIDAATTDGVRFAPGRLGELMRRLADDGVPTPPSTPASDTTRPAPAPPLEIVAERDGERHDPPKFGDRIHDSPDVGSPEPPPAVRPDRRDVTRKLPRAATSSRTQSGRAVVVAPADDGGLLGNSHESAVLAPESRRRVPTERW